jgi:hypothetical protein
MEHRGREFVNDYLGEIINQCVFVKNVNHYLRKIMFDDKQQETRRETRHINFSFICLPDYEVETNYGRDVHLEVTP